MCLVCSSCGSDNNDYDDDDDDDDHYHVRYYFHYSHDYYLYYYSEGQYKHLLYDLGYVKHLRCFDSETSGEFPTGNETP